MSGAEDAGRPSEADVSMERLQDCLDAVLQQTQGAGPSATHITLPIGVADDIARVLDRATRPAPAGDAAEVDRLRAEVAASEADRDALLAAIGFKGGPLGDGSRRDMILKEATALRPEMVKAREHARRMEGDASLWWLSTAEGHHNDKPLLLTAWRQRKAAEKTQRAAEARTTAAEAALDEVRAENQRLLAQVATLTTALDATADVLAAKKVELGEARAALRSVEWASDASGPYSFGGERYPLCPSCGGWKPRAGADYAFGHAPDCALAAILTPDERTAP